MLNECSDADNGNDDHKRIHTTTDDDVCLPWNSEICIICVLCVYVPESSDGEIVLLSGEKPTARYLVVECDNDDDVNNT